ncbi:MAG: Fur family transcriptional regulator [Acidobacteria bacterium]|nr:Fur family transcriptional regulator [Acidobacteriota bacterium]
MALQENKLSEFEHYLQNHGLKSTRERQAIAREVLLIIEHFDPELLQSRLRRKGTRVSRATIYRTLDHLINSGLVRKTSLDIEHKAAFYENTIVRQHHEHMVCIGCGVVIEFTSDEIESLQDEICDKYSFKPVRHTHQIMGYCRKCH